MSFLEPVEVDALLAAPDLGRWEGRRDRTLLLAVQTGLRLSELTGLNCGDIELGVEAHVRCLGEGPQAALRPAHTRYHRHPAGLVEGTNGLPNGPVFPLGLGAASATTLSKHGL